MAGIRISGMASGLPPDIVEQIMAAERIPIKQMEVTKAKSDDKLKLVGELETKVSDITKNLNELTGVGGFLDKKLVSSDPNIVDGTLDPATAVPGNYSIEVIQLAQKPSAISNGFPDRDKTTLGTGYLKFETPEGTKEVYLSGTESTLEGIVKQVNSTNVGLKAQIIEDRKDAENPFRLLISGLALGSDNQVNFPKIYMLDGDQDLFFEQSREAKNAKVKIDGFEVELPDNKVKDLFPGVTLDLKSVAPGREITMNVKENTEVISGKIKTFVDSYNAALEFIQKQNKLQGANGKNPALGPLGGDSMLRSIESKLRNTLLNSQVGVQSPIKRVSELGIEFNRNGTLNFSQDKFNKVLASNPSGVAAFFRGDGFNVGFIPTVKREIQTLTQLPYGTLANRKKGLTDKIGQINDRIDSKEKQLEKKEESLRRKFANLESKMSEMQGQQAKFAAMSQQQG